MEIPKSSVTALLLFSILLPILPVATFYAIYYGVFDGQHPLREILLKSVETGLLGYFLAEPLSQSARGLISALSAVGVVNLVRTVFCEFSESVCLCRLLLHLLWLLILRRSNRWKSLRKRRNSRV